MGNGVGSFDASEMRKGSGGIADFFKDFSDLFNSRNFGASSTSRRESSMGGFGFGQRFGSKWKSNKSIKFSINCTLEELYTGAVKKLKVRDRFNGKSSIMEKIFIVKILPGYKKGTKIKFPPSHDFPKQVVFEINELPHRYFQRSKKGTGNDIKWTCHITRQQLDRGAFIRIPQLDAARTIFVIDTKEYSASNRNAVDIISHGKKLTFPGLGMPIITTTTTGEEESRKYGNLVVKFEIVG